VASSGGQYRLRKKIQGSYRENKMGYVKFRDSLEITFHLVAGRKEIGLLLQTPEMAGDVK